MRQASAALVVTILACGAPRTPSQVDGDITADGIALDGPGTDGMTDSASADALPVIPPEYECDVTQSGNVTVHTAGTNDVILVHDVFGTVVTRTVSGPTRTVIVNVPGCGAVTSESQRIFHTITYVRAGDELWINAPYPFPQASQGPGHLYIDVDAPGATSYWSEGDASTSTPANDPTERNLYWTNYYLDAAGRGTFALHPQDPMTGGPALTPYHAFENIVLADTIQTPLHVTSWSSATTAIQLQLQFGQDAQLLAAGLRNWAPNLDILGHSTFTTINGATYAVSGEVPAYGAGITMSASFRLSPSGNGRQHYQVMPWPQGVSTVDLSQGLLPEVSTMTVTPAVSRPTASWTFQTGTWMSPDVIVLRVLGNAEWRIALPPGMTTYQLPQLPPDLAINFSVVDFGLTQYEVSEYSGYADARGRFVESFIGGRNVPPGVTFRWARYGENAL